MKETSMNRAQKTMDLHRIVEAIFLIFSFKRNSINKNDIFHFLFCQLRFSGSITISFKDIIINIWLCNSRNPSFHAANYKDNLPKEQNIWISSYILISKEVRETKITQKVDKFTREMHYLINGKKEKRKKAGR